ncbi:YjfB family protein [Azospira restricta]|uniref:YjfB family protein n=1 Tax=Azospira restricta TaxID=404405 RepID=A0A974SPZ2_9RHOO|nr:YjfB family protein [Azospira restricta]QRJ64312.1 YjfB family protein [Azospira restricta]
MDLAAVASTVSALSAQQAGDAVGTLVLKKALDLQAQNAAQLLAALPQPAPYNNPPHLGGKVDLFA